MALFGTECSNQLIDRKDPSSQVKESNRNLIEILDEIVKRAKPQDVALLTLDLFELHLLNIERRMTTSLNSESEKKNLVRMQKELESVKGRLLKAYLPLDQSAKQKVLQSIEWYQELHRSYWKDLRDLERDDSSEYSKAIGYGLQKNESLFKELKSANK